MPPLTSPDQSISRSVSPEDGADDIPASTPPTQPKTEDESEDTKDHSEGPVETATKTPAKQSKKGRKRERPKKEEKVKTPEGSVVDDGSDVEQYEVEKIVGHKYKGKNLLWKVRWAGYTEADDSWEPLDNLMPESQLLLEEYVESIGGPSELLLPIRKKQVRKSASKAGLNKAQNGTDSPPAKRSKVSHRTASRTLNPDSQEWKSQPIGTWTPDKNTQSWEDFVHEVETVERDDQGNLHAFIRFRNGKRSKIANNIYTMRCPRALLRFYENHLSV